MEKVKDIHGLVRRLKANGAKVGMSYQGASVFLHQFNDDELDMLMDSPFSKQEGESYAEYGIRMSMKKTAQFFINKANKR